MQLTLLPGVEFVLALRDPTSKCPFGEYEPLKPMPRSACCIRLWRRIAGRMTRSLVTTSTLANKATHMRQRRKMKSRKPRPWRPTSPTQRPSRAAVATRDRHTRGVQESCGNPTGSQHVLLCLSGRPNGVDPEKLNLTDEPWGYFFRGRFASLMSTVSGCLLVLTLVPTPRTANFVAGSYRRARFRSRTS